MYEQSDASVHINEWEVCSISGSFELFYYYYYIFVIARLTLQNEIAFTYNETDSAAVAKFCPTGFR